MTTKTKDSSGTVTMALPLLEVEVHKIRVEGTSSLISHKWSEKAMAMILGKQMKRSSVGKEAKDPEADFRDSLYPYPDGGYGFPAVGFKAAAVRAGTYSDQRMTFLRGAFHVPGELVKIIGEATPREDMVRIGQGTADIRYRGEFLNWSAEIPVRLNTRALSLEQLVNLFRIGGFSVGVGEWRPERNGPHGMFDVIGTTQVG